MGLRWGKGRWRAGRKGEKGWKEAVRWQTGRKEERRADGGVNGGMKVERKRK